MLVKLLSTPRTGSVHYSYVLRDKYNAKLINEFFNQYHMSIYFQETNGVTLNHTSYIDGSFYRDYYIDGDFLAVRKIYEQRKRTVAQEEEHRLQLINTIDFNAHNIVLHNHVAPINEQAYEELLSMADKNVFVYRKDKRAQLASYAIAFSTKQFVLFKPELKTTYMVPDIDKVHLENLVRRIEIYDRLHKSDEIAYEDMTFNNAINYPVKQVDDYKSLLSGNMLQIIDDLVNKYEEKKC